MEATLCSMAAASTIPIAPIGSTVETPDKEPKNVNKDFLDNVRSIAPLRLEMKSLLVCLF